jgi:hypothetical protein
MKLREGGLKYETEAYDKKQRFYMSPRRRRKAAVQT